MAPQQPVERSSEVKIAQSQALLELARHMRSWWLGPVMLAMGVAVHADDYSPPPPLPLASPITDHFALRAGFFWGSIDTFGRFDSAKGVEGTPFTAEHDLGLTDQARQIDLEIMFRLEERSRLRVNFLDTRRGGRAHHRPQHPVRRYNLAGGQPGAVGIRLAADGPDLHLLVPARRALRARCRGRHSSDRSRRQSQGSPRPRNSPISAAPARSPRWRSTAPGSSRGTGR